jgi:hypothetical protein
VTPELGLEPVLTVTISVGVGLIVALGAVLWPRIRDRGRDRLSK